MRSARDGVALDEPADEGEPRDLVRIAALVKVEEREPEQQREAPPRDPALDGFNHARNRLLLSRTSPALC